MRRRDFLRQTGMALTALAGASVRSSAGVQPLAFSQRRAARSGVPKKVIIVGAGLAGLSAGYELTHAGHDVLILEARSRPGGRVHTLRDGFADGLHAEAGAARIPNHHHFTLKYVELFGLTLEPFQPSNTSTIYYARGRRMQVEAGKAVDWPYRLTPDERTLGLSGLRRKYIGAMFAALGDVTDPHWPAETLKRYDLMNRSDFWRSHGASSEVIDLLSWGGFDDRADTVSALYMLRNAALNRDVTSYQKISGGNDLLPKAFASRLSDRIRYAAPVTRIDRGENGVSVVFRQGVDVDQAQVLVIGQQTPQIGGREKLDAGRGVRRDYCLRRQQCRGAGRRSVAARAALPAIPRVPRV